MSPSAIEPESASCSVAIVRISVDLPAPFGPSSPNMPVGIVSETSCSALTPLGYVLDRPSMRSSSMASPFGSIWIATVLRRAGGKVGLRRSEQILRNVHPRQFDGNAQRHGDRRIGFQSERR